tara:strand:- start:4310 stop:5806 length:1497 start_codon:yes stop_codon:yes gene_type:complete
MPGNPLDLFVENRVTTINYNPDRVDNIYHFSLPSGDDFDEREIDIIQSILNNPMGHSLSNHRSCIINAAAYTWPGNFTDGYYDIITRFLEWLWDNHEIMWIDGHYSDTCTLPMFIKYRHNYNGEFDWDDVYCRHHEHTIIALHKEDCLFGIINNSGDEAWFSDGGDYVYDEYSDRYYINDTVSDAHDVTWRECCERYMSCSHNSCCDNAQDNEGEAFDESYTNMYSKKDLTFLNLTKVSGMDYTFGVELETCYSRSVNYTSEYNMKAVYDGSTDGLEYVSGVLQGNKGIENIEGMCSYLTDQGAKVDRKCGVHVHVGGAEFNRRFSIMVLKLCLAIENDIYKLLPDSRQGNSYCKKLPKDLVERMNFHNYKDTLGNIIQNSIISREYNKKKNHPGGHYNSQRYYWVNITNYSTTTGTNTIEFRPHSGSLDFKKIYNWLLICMSIVKFAENRQRRIWTSSMSKHPITLKEVLQYSLNNKLFNHVFEYCNGRARRFNNIL